MYNSVILSGKHIKPLQGESHSLLSAPPESSARDPLSLYTTLETRELTWLALARSMSKVASPLKKGRFGDGCLSVERSPAESRVRGWLVDL